MLKFKSQVKSIRFAGYHVASSVRLSYLFLLALASLLLWWGMETALGGFRPAASAEMHEAARLMQISTQLIRAEKRQRGLLQAAGIDPAQTGLIGPEYSETTTSMGILQAKRTATNPDLAAAIVREIDSLQLPSGSPVVLLMSGSIVGANIAALSAVQALGLKPLVISSLGSSMYGATDPEFTWLDMLQLLIAQDLFRPQQIAAVVGGDGAVGRSLSQAGQEALRQNIADSGVPLINEASAQRVIEQLMALLKEETTTGWPLLINVGGSVAALGTCENGALLPTGLITEPSQCEAGVPGLVLATLAQGGQVLHILNMKSLAGQWGLPYDPIPLPVPGNNRLVYGNE